MDQSPASSTWATVAARGHPSRSNPQAGHSEHTPLDAYSPNAENLPRYLPSPRHLPATSQPGSEAIYVLTLLTSKGLHARMTALRKAYFPVRLNKLSAHLTLFHALPGSRLADTIVPDLQRLARETAPFAIRATRPFRLKRGIAIGIAGDEGGRRAQEVHRALRERWEGQGQSFLSEQDAAGGGRLHYTIMNKVDDEADVVRALREVEAEWREDVGMAEGLGLWRYEKGWWKWERKFTFSGDSASGE